MVVCRVVCLTLGLRSETVRLRSMRSLLCAIWMRRPRCTGRYVSVSLPGQAKPAVICRRHSQSRRLVGVYPLLGLCVRGCVVPTCVRTWWSSAYLARWP